MLINLRKKMTNQKGFTLIELLVVISIIGVLASIAIPKMVASTAAAKDGKLLAELRTLDSAITLHYANHDNKYPEEGVTALEKAIVTDDKLLATMPKCADGTTALTYTYTAGAPGYALTGVKSDGTTVLRSPGSIPATVTP